MNLINYKNQPWNPNDSFCDTQSFNLSPNFTIYNPLMSLFAGFGIIIGFTGCIACTYRYKFTPYSLVYLTFFFMNSFGLLAWVYLFLYIFYIKYEIIILRNIYQ